MTIVMVSGASQPLDDGLYSLGRCWQELICSLPLASGPPDHLHQTIRYSVENPRPFDWWLVPPVWSVSYSGSSLSRRIARCCSARRTTRAQYLGQPSRPTGAQRSSAYVREGAGPSSCSPSPPASPAHPDCPPSTCHRPLPHRRRLTSRSPPPVCSSSIRSVIDFAGAVAAYRWHSKEIHSLPRHHCCPSSFHCHHGVAFGYDIANWQSFYQVGDPP